MPTNGITIDSCVKNLEHNKYGSKVAFTTLFIASIFPAISTIIPIDQHMLFLIILTILTPYMILGLMNLSRRVVAVSMIISC